jgi:hypothetical protein
LLISLELCTLPISKVQKVERRRDEVPLSLTRPHPAMPKSSPGPFCALCLASLLEPAVVVRGVCPVHAPACRWHSQFTILWDAVHAVQTTFLAYPMPVNRQATSATILSATVGHFPPRFCWFALVPLKHETKGTFGRNARLVQRSAHLLSRESAMQVLSDEVPQQAGSVVQPHQDTAVMYNPYAGLQNISPRGPHTFRVNREPEFVFQEEAAVRRRGFATNIGFYTGTGYLGGALAGGSLGLARTLMLPATSSPLPQSRRLLINRILNSSGHSGRTAGLSLS